MNSISIYICVCDYVCVKWMPPKTWHTSKPIMAYIRYVSGCIMG